MSRLLIVDDERDLRHLYAEELREEGYEVRTAGSGEQALALMEDSHFDLLILDVQLDKESGLDLLQKITGEERGLPVILCTAFSSYRDDFTAWLADAYVVKSADFSQLKREIRRVLEGREPPGGDPHSRRH